MKKLNQEEQDFFFAIIRAAVWEHEVEGPIPESIDWEALIEAFSEHSILGTVASTLIKLSAEVKELAPYMGTVVFPFVANLTRTHNKLDQAIVEVFDKLESQGCHPVLLKGQGLSALYPKTCVRSCGDIDIYVRESEYEKACYTINDMLGIDNAVVDIYKNPRHFHIERGNIIYEIHRVVIDNTKYVGNNNAINKLTQDTLSSESIPFVEISGKAINIPPKEFNDWYIFFHLYKHYVKNIGIRQFIDWLLVIKSDKELDPRKLQDNLTTIGLLKEWNQLGYILTHYLGLPTKDFPLYDAKHHMMEDYDVQKIATCGDFGKNIYRNIPYKDKKFGIFRAISALIYHTSNIYEVAKKRSWGFALYSYKSIVKRGIARFYKRMFK